jgi:hypothetical protein
MYRYKYDKSYHQRSRKAHRRVVLAVAVTTFVVGLAGYVTYDFIRQMLSKEAPVSNATYSSVQGATVNLFSTPYFQFQTDDTWKEVTAEQKAGHYVYRSFKDGLVLRDITVDVNKKDPVPLALSRTNHVYPVTVDKMGRLIAQGGAGDHCKTLLPKNTPAVPTIVKQRQISFPCTPDSTLYQVAVGVIGGDTNIRMPRPDGSKATYVITYRDLTISPTDAALRNILASFQTK